VLARIFVSSSGGGNGSRRPDSKNGGSGGEPQVGEGSKRARSEKAFQKYCQEARQEWQDQRRGQAQQGETGAHHGQFVSEEAVQRNDRPGGEIGDQWSDTRPGLVEDCHDGERENRSPRGHAASQGADGDALESRTTAQPVGHQLSGQNYGEEARHDDGHDDARCRQENVFPGDLQALAVAFLRTGEGNDAQNQRHQPQSDRDSVHG